MGDSKLKANLLVSVSLTPGQRVPLNAVMNFSTRCGGCKTMISQGENELQIRRFNQVFDDLKLYQIDDLPKSEQEELYKLNSKEHETVYELKLETARHLLAILDKKVRFSSGAPIILTPLLKSLEDQVPKSAAEMDSEATASEKPPVARFEITLSPDERETVLMTYVTPNICMFCGSITDGPEARKDIYNLTSAFHALELNDFFNRTPVEILQFKKDNPESKTCVITLDEANALNAMLCRRIGFVPKGPRKLVKLLKILEEIKAGTYSRKNCE